MKVIRKSMDRCYRYSSLKFCQGFTAIVFATFFTVSAVYRLVSGNLEILWTKKTYNPSSTLLQEDIILFHNEAAKEKFPVRISLTAKQQFDLFHKLQGKHGMEHFLPTKRNWTTQDRFTNEWTQLDILSQDSHNLLDDTKNPCWTDVHNVMRCLPYMFLIGAPKCGTTDLYERLLQHPDFIEPVQKEPHWITRRRLGEKSQEKDITERDVKKIGPFSDYLSYFKKLATKVTAERREHLTMNTVNLKITGDCSASTLWDNDIWTELPRNDNPLEPIFTNPHYVYKLNPKAKIVVLLRDPVARLYSDYLYFLPGAIKKSPALFHNEVVKCLRLFSSCMKVLSLRSCVYNPKLNLLIPLRLRIGIYYIYMQEWFDVFPSNQILVLRTEHYANSTIRTTQDVYRFLGLRQLNETYLSTVTTARRKNVRKLSDVSVGDMWPETKQLLRSFYSTFNLLLEKLLKQKMSK